MVYNAKAISDFILRRLYLKGGRVCPRMRERERERERESEREREREREGSARGGYV